MAPDDESLYEAARESMVTTQIFGRGVRDPAVLDAMRSVPRHAFVAPALRESAYVDAALPADGGQTISQPYMVGLMTESLLVGPGDHVLEVGTGTGYQAAVLATIGARVVSIERDAVLATEARRRLSERGHHANVRIVVGDGSLGHPDGAPYDAIVVTAGAPRVPFPLVDQLREGGRLVVPVGGERAQDLLRITKRGDGSLVREVLVSCAFVPLVGAHGWPDRAG